MCRCRYEGHYEVPLTNLDLRLAETVRRQVPSPCQQREGYHPKGSADVGKEQGSLYRQIRSPIHARGHFRLGISSERAIVNHGLLALLRFKYAHRFNH